MPFCQNCGVEVSDIANFCHSCGKSTVKITNNKKEVIPIKNASIEIFNFERKRKWTDEALIEEYKKNGTIEKFK